MTVCKDGLVPATICCFVFLASIKAAQIIHSSHPSPSSSVYLSRRSATRSKETALQRKEFGVFYWFRAKLVRNQVEVQKVVEQHFFVFWSLSLIMTCSGSYKPSPNHTGPHWQTCDISLDIALRNLSARTRQQSAEWSLPSPFICKSTFSFNCIIPIEVKQTVNWACSLQACREGRATRR